jgi:hypothetical protein
MNEGEGGELDCVGSGEGCRIWRQEAEICLQRWADMVYVGDMLTGVSCDELWDVYVSRLTRCLSGRDDGGGINSLSF